MTAIASHDWRWFVVSGLAFLVFLGLTAYGLAANNSRERAEQRRATRTKARHQDRRPATSHQPLRTVAHGGPVARTFWSILAGPDPHREGELLTFVQRERDGHRARSGMGGPKLPDGALLNTWHGTATGVPPFVLLRADPTVQAVTVHTARGQHHHLELTESVEGLGLRFAAGPLDDGDAPAEVTVVLTDDSSFTSPYLKPRQLEV